MIRNLIITLEKNERPTNSISTKSVHAIEGHVHIIILGQAGNFVSFPWFIQNLGASKLLKLNALFYIISS